MFQSNSLDIKIVRINEQCLYRSDNNIILNEFSTAVPDVTREEQHSLPLQFLMFPLGTNI